MTGVVIAGGRGRRMGGVSKPAAPLAGRHLIDFPLSALCEGCERVAVVCKRDTVLPRLAPGIERWDEPPRPRHPAAGVAHALGVAGEAVLVCAADMPFVTAEACRRLVATAEKAHEAGVVVAQAAGWLQPTFAVYRQEALPSLRACGDRQLTQVVQRLEPVLVEMAPDQMRSVDTPEALAAAERELTA